MNFQAYLETLRAKPEHKKKQFAFWTSFGFCAILLMFWFATFTSTSTASSSSSTVAAVANNAGTPAQSLVAGVGSIYDSVVNFFFAPKVIHYKQLEVLPGK